MASVFTQLRQAFGGLWPRWGGQGAGSRVEFYLPGSTFDYASECGDLWRNSIVSLALQWKADRFCRPPIRVCKIDRKGDYQPLPKHPLVDLWSRPSPHFTRRAVETAVGLSLDCDGNGYVHKVRDNAGRLAELWWVPHDKVFPVWPEDGSEFISGWEVWVEGERYRVPAEDILHFRRGIDPANVRLGLSPLKSQLREVCTVNEASGYTASLLRNSAVPGLMVVPDNDMVRPSKEDAERIKERVASAYSGDERGGTVVLAGRYKIQPVGFSPEQLRLDVLPQAAVARVAGALGVAPMSMGLPDPGKTYSNLEESNRASWGGIQSTQDLIAETLRWSLLPEFGTDPYTHVVEYDYSNVNELQESLDSLHARTREDYKYGVVQLNEARDLIGLEAVPDGDRFFTDAGPAPSALPSPFGNPAPNGDGNVPAVNGAAKRWSY
jgi:HK97 family phage portal protein